MTPEDDFPPANDKLKGILRSKAPWETGGDEKQEPHVWQTQHAETVSKDAYDGVLRELFAVADELTTLRAERDELREALEMMVDDHCDYMRLNKLGDPEKQHTIKFARAALSTEGDGDD